MSKKRDLFKSSVAALAIATASMPTLHAAGYNAGLIPVAEPPLSVIAGQMAIVSDPGPVCTAPLSLNISLGKGSLMDTGIEVLKLGTEVVGIYLDERGRQRLLDRYDELSTKINDLRSLMVERQDDETKTEQALRQLEVERQHLGVVLSAVQDAARVQSEHNQLENQDRQEQKKILQAILDRLNAKSLVRSPKRHSVMTVGSQPKSRDTSDSSGGVLLFVKPSPYAPWASDALHVRRYD